MYWFSSQRKTQTLGHPVHGEYDTTTKDTLKDMRSQTGEGLFKILFDVACSTV